MIKQCFFSQNNIKYVDYKDLDLIKKFINPHARIMGSKKTATSARSQRQLAEAIKRARFMGLLPYLSR
ncbi:MAG: 30S ribosomal protein S18 [Candidatus Taylorbacteria bacterium RIFOXYD2_FULL_36_9]|uniref:Small ribosomal subunit protein bS18 n=1 Tax=Candidatus Taylorbacteria bacterium RIFOXYD2_FULL_36_9 TaxID=1802338 RepID=A0A1G2PD50_9BACT|nr:MAG: 30S ribosomal protein S18 [Candidatus Taylorbacteria bacterium RIFOXYD2_FULL_36_9]